MKCPEYENTQKVINVSSLVLQQQGDTILLPMRFTQKEIKSLLWYFCLKCTARFNQDQTNPNWGTFQKNFWAVFFNYVNGMKDRSRLRICPIWRQTNKIRQLHVTHKPGLGSRSEKNISKTIGEFEDCRLDNSILLMLTFWFWSFHWDMKNGNIWVN